eukprot:3183249-Pyramimonas_sp.AAC.1
MAHYVMAKISCSHQGVSHRLWIDDLSQSLAGSRQKIASSLSACLADAADELKKMKLQIAAKSCVVCSHHGDAKEIVRRLRRRGFTVQANLQAGFLGVDLGGGRRTARE